jgi:hypothetical protein
VNQFHQQQQHQQQQRGDSEGLQSEITPEESNVTKQSAPPEDVDDDHKEEGGKVKQKSSLKDFLCFGCEGSVSDESVGAAVGGEKNRGQKTGPN